MLGKIKFRIILIIQFERWALISIFDLVLSRYLFLHQEKTHSEKNTTVEMTIPTPNKRKALKRLLTLNFSFFLGRSEYSGAEQRYGFGRKDFIQYSTIPIE